MQTAGAHMHRHGCFPPSLSPSETAPARIPNSDSEFGQHLFFDEPFLGDFDAGFYSAIEQSCSDSTAGLNIDGTYSLASVNATFFEPLPFPSVVTNVAQPPQLLLQPTPTTGAFMAWDHADNGPSVSESASTILKTELVSEPPAVSDTESVRHASPVSEPVSADQTSSPEADDDANGDADMDCVRDGSPGESSSDAAATTPAADGADIKHVCAASAGPITCSTSSKPAKRSRRSSDCASTRSLRNSSTSQQPAPLRNLRPSSTAKHSGGGSSSSSSSSGSGSDREEAQTKRPYMRKLTVADLERHYELPLADASRALGLSATMLKKVCRSFGIRRWPHRQLASIDKMIARTDERIAGHAADLAQIAGAGDLVEEATRKMLASLRAQLAFLRDKKGAIRRATSRGLHVRALRQADLPDGDDAAALHDAADLRAPAAAGADADVDRVPPLAATPPALVPTPAPPLGDGFDSVASATAQLLHMQQQLLQLQQQHNDMCQAQPAGQACQHGQLQDLQKQLLHLLQQRIAVDTMRAQADAAAATAGGAMLLVPSPAINAQQQQQAPPLPPSAPAAVRAARRARRAPPLRADGGSESCIPALDDLEDDFEDSDMAHYL